MPDERLITELESILQRVVELGAEKERTRLGPNLLVTNAAPSGLANYVLVKDDRDGDNILALKVPGVVYNNNDLVNVLFVRGGEAIAFQQGSGSSSSGIWGIVAGTSTDIYYNSGDVGIGKTVAPDARLEILDTTQAQLRLTYQEDTDYVEFTVDTNADLLIKPSLTGQIKLQPTTDSTDFFQVLDADGGTPVLNVDATNEKVCVGTATSDGLLTLEGPSGLASILTLSGTATSRSINIDNDLIASGSVNILRFVCSVDPQISPVVNVFGVNLNPNLGGSTSNNVTIFTNINLNSSFEDSYNGTLNTIRRVRIADHSDNSSASPSVVNTYGFYADELTSGTGGNWAIYTRDATRSYLGATALNVTADAKLHIKQGGSAEAIPVELLEQLDVDEPFTKYIGTAAAATLTRSIVAEADVTTATRQGFIKIEVQDDGNQVTDQDYFVPFFTLA